MQLLLLQNVSLYVLLLPLPTTSFGTVSSWAIRYAADCVAEVATRTLTAEAPNYAVIMEIDRRVREFPFPDVPPSALDMSPPPMTSPIPEAPLAQSMGRLVLSHSRETRKQTAFVPLAIVADLLFSTTLHSSQFLCAGYH